MDCEELSIPSVSRDQLPEVAPAQMVLLEPVPGLLFLPALKLIYDISLF